MTAADDIAKLLRDNGADSMPAICGVPVCGDVVIATEDQDEVYSKNTPPISTYNIITVAEQGGISSRQNLRRDTAYIIISVRGLTEAVAQVLAQLVEHIMLTALPATINGTYYYRARPTGGADSYRGKTPNGVHYLHQQEYDVEVQQQ